MDQPIVMDTTGDNTKDQFFIADGRVLHDVNTRLQVMEAPGSLPAQLATKASQSDLDIQTGRISNLVAVPNASFYKKTTNGTTGALLVVASGATIGQINLASVTPLSTGYTPIVGDYVLLVYGVASGSAELIDIRIGANGTTYANAGDSVRVPYTQLRQDLTDNGIIAVKNCVSAAQTSHYWGNTNTLEANTGYCAITVKVRGGEVYSFPDISYTAPDFCLIVDKYGTVIDRFTVDKLTPIGSGYYATMPANASELHLTNGNSSWYTTSSTIVVQGLRDISGWKISDYPIGGPTKYVEIQNDIHLKDGTPLNKVYYVGSTREFTKLKDAVEEAIQYMDSVIYVDAGIYDLVAEFGQSYLDNYADQWVMIGIFLKNRVRIIFSSGAKVIFNYTGTNANTQIAFSPFNAGVNGFTLENAWVESTNCRYSMHDERGHDSDSYHNIYKRCTFIHDSSNASGWHGAQAIGGGLGRFGDIRIEDCYTTSVANDDTISYHGPTITTAGDNSRSSLVIKGTYTSGTIDLIELGTSTEKTRALITGCNLRIAPKLEIGTVDNIEIVSWGNTIRN